MALSKNAAAVLDAIKAAQTGISVFDLEGRTYVNYNTIRRITQELRAAGLISAVKAAPVSVDRVLFVPTVASCDADQTV